jgi:diguanylate cyclase (GGDEF)-like protein
MSNYDLLPCSVLITDSSCKITYCNTLLANTLKQTIANITDQNFDHLLTNGSKIIFQQIILPSILNQEKMDEIQLNFSDADNNKIPVVVFARQDESDNNKIFWCCFPATGRNQLLDALNQSKKQLENSNSQLKTLSTTDDLTGCYNRREMSARLLMIRRQMERRKRSFAILMLDLDHFKQLNDNHGHAEGDYVLKQFSHLLMSSARFDDVVSRYGGEEFIIILPDIDAYAANKIAARIHENMKNIITKSNIVTVSIGICVVPYDTIISDHDIIEMADKAMYKSKTSGRNQTTLHSSISTVSKSALSK